MLKTAEEIERGLKDYQRMNKAASTSSQSIKMIEMNVHLVCYSFLQCLILAETLFCHRSQLKKMKV